jgi:hypothetical protein
MQFTIDMYQLKVEVKFYSDMTKLYNAYKRYINKYNVKEIDAGNANQCQGMVLYESSTMDKVIILFASDELSHNIITHEAYHLTNLIMYVNNIVPNLEEDENLALLNGYINQKIFEIIKIKKIKIK